MSDLNADPPIRQRSTTLFSGARPSTAEAGNRSNARCLVLTCSDTCPMPRYNQYPAAGAPFITAPAEKDAMIVKLYNAGWTYRRIAKAVGFRSAGSWHTPWGASPRDGQAATREPSYGGLSEDAPPAPPLPQARVPAGLPAPPPRYPWLHAGSG
jgi:hypothetical protein